MSRKSTMRTKWAAAAAAMAVAVIGVGLWWTYAAPAAPATLESGAYALHYDFALQRPRPGGEQETISATINGTLHLGRRQASHMAGRLRVDSLVLNAGARRLGFLQKGAKQALSRPFSLAMGPRGQVTEVQLSSDLPLAVRSVLATVAHGTQYVAPVKPAAKQWRTQETDANGEYEATYRVLSPDEVEKTWTLGQDDPFGSVLGHANAVYALEGSRVQAVTLEQKGEALAGRSDGPRSPFELALSLVRTGNADTAWLEAGSDAPQLEPFTTRTGVPKNIRVAAPPPRPKGELLTALSTVDGTESLSEHTELRNELTEAVRRDPTVAEPLEQLLRREKVAIHQARYAVEALLGARTPQADARAARLLRDATVTQTARTLLLGGATLLDNPGRPVVDAVRSVMTSGEPPLRGQAAMAAAGIATQFSRSEVLQQGAVNGGSATQPPTPAPAEPPNTSEPSGDADASDDSDGSDADALAAAVIEMARRVLLPGPNAPPATFGAKARFLRALGNLGTPECLPLVRAGLEDDNLLVRAVAATALRFQDPAAVKEDLAKGMDDPALEVRAAVIKAARKMGPAAARDLVRNALYFDESEYVRLQAVYTFGAWSREAPSLVTTLTNAAEREESAKVLREIRAMTQKNRVEPPFRVDPLDEDDG